jgi:ABC-type lipoprotein release transport system permease subunit
MQEAGGQIEKQEELEEEEEEETYIEKVMTGNMSWLFAGNQGCLLGIQLARSLLLRYYLPARLWIPQPKSGS